MGSELLPGRFANPPELNKLIHLFLAELDNRRFSLRERPLTTWQRQDTCVLQTSCLPRRGNPKLAELSMPVSSLKPVSERKGEGPGALSFHVET